MPPQLLTFKSISACNGLAVQRPCDFRSGFSRHLDVKCDRFSFSDLDGVEVAAIDLGRHCYINNILNY